MEYRGTSFEHLLAHQSDGVLIRTSLPRRVRITEEDRGASGEGQLHATSHLHLTKSPRVLAGQGGDVVREGLFLFLGSVLGGQTQLQQSARCPIP